MIEPVSEPVRLFPIEVPGAGILYVSAQAHHGVSRRIWPKCTAFRAGMPLTRCADCNGTRADHGGR